MVVTFCGHSTVHPREPVETWLRETVAALIARGADKFYLGGYGAFDLMAASVVWELKKGRPDIASVLVLPYLDRKVCADNYDYTTYPPLETVPKRFAISKRNEWMIQNSDVAVAYVTHDWGGAAATLKFAERKGKGIIRYPPRSNKRSSRFSGVGRSRVRGVSSDSNGASSSSIRYALS